MIKHKYTYISLFVLLFFAARLQAQQNPSFQIHRTWHMAMELLNKEKFVAAAEQFRLVERAKLPASNQPRFESELSLMQENAQYYIALCALESGNDDGESLFLKFIKEHPENPLTKLAYYHIGRKYSKMQQYQEALTWFNKITADDLNAGDNTEYKFRKGYAYYATGDFKNAATLFGQVKDKRFEFQDDAIYYYAYIAYNNKDYHLALVNFERLKNSKRYEASYPYYITSVYFMDKRYDDVINYAIPILKNTIQQNEKEMLRLIAASYFAKADYTNAAVYYDRFDDEDHGQSATTQDNYQMGYTYYKIGSYAKAAAELEKLQQQTDVYA